MMQLPSLRRISAVKRLFAEHLGQRSPLSAAGRLQLWAFFVPAELANKGNAHVQ